MEGFWWQGKIGEDSIVQTMQEISNSIGDFFLTLMLKNTDRSMLGISYSLTTVSISHYSMKLY